MIAGAALRDLTVAIADACRSGLDPEALRAAVLPKLRRAVPIDALWWATADPATLLFTQTYRDGLPEEIGPYFVQNEFLVDDVNKWTDLARSRAGARTLIEATGGELDRSARYRDIFGPLGLSDELRVVLRTRGTCWGFMCLHRGGPDVFSPDETQFIRGVAPHLAEGIRLGLLVREAGGAQHEDAPGLVLLADDGTVVGANAAAGAGSTSFATRGSIVCFPSRSTRSRPSSDAQPTRWRSRLDCGCARAPGAGS